MIPGNVDAGTFAPLVVVLAGMGAFLKIIFAYLQREAERHEKEMREQREAFTTFLGNHMSGNTRAMENVVKASEKIRDDIHDEAELTRATVRDVARKP